MSRHARDDLNSFCNPTQRYSSSESRYQTEPALDGEVVFIDVDLQSDLLEIMVRSSCRRMISLGTGFPKDLFYCFPSSEGLLFSASLDTQGLQGSTVAFFPGCTAFLDAAWYDCAHLQIRN